MTFREKLQMEHPWMNETIIDVVIKELCPCDLGYEKRNEVCHHYRPDEECIRCWNREMPLECPNSTRMTNRKMPNTEPKHTRAEETIKAFQKEFGVHSENAIDKVLEKELKKADYEQGMNDAWELAKKIWSGQDSENVEMFGTKFVYEIYQLSPQEALAKMKAYEEAQSKIGIGDVVKYAGNKGLVLYCPYNKFLVLTHDGWIQEWYDCDVEKTGKHIDIKSILEQIGE